MGDLLGNEDTMKCEVDGHLMMRISCFRTRFNFGLNISIRQVFQDFKTAKGSGNLSLHIHTLPEKKSVKIIST